MAPGCRESVKTGFTMQHASSSATWANSWILLLPKRLSNPKRLGHSGFPDTNNDYNPMVVIPLVRILNPFGKFATNYLCSGVGGPKLIRNQVAVSSGADGVAVCREYHRGSIEDRIADHRRVASNIGKSSHILAGPMATSGSLE